MERYCQVMERSGCAMERRRWASQRRGHAWERNRKALKLSVFRPHEAPRLASQPAGAFTLARSRALSAYSIAWKNPAAVNTRNQSLNASARALSSQGEVPASFREPTRSTVGQPVESAF